MKKIVITEFMDTAAVEFLQAHYTVVYDPLLVDDAARLLGEVADADALIVRNRTQVRGELLAALTRATVVGRLGVGLDNIDVPACEARGIKVIPASGDSALAVPEYVIGTAMMLLRGVYRDSVAVTQGDWPRGCRHQRGHAARASATDGSRRDDRLLARPYLRARRAVTREMNSSSPGPGNAASAMHIAPITK